MKEVLFLIISLCVCLSSFYSCEGKEAVNDEKSKQSVQSEDSVYSSEESIKKEDSNVLTEEKLSFTYEDAVAYFKDSRTDELPVSQDGICMGIADFSKWLDGSSDLLYPTLDPNYDGTGDPHDHIIGESIYKSEEAEQMRFFCNDMKFYTLRLKNKNISIFRVLRCYTNNLKQLHSYAIAPPESQKFMIFLDSWAEITYRISYLDFSDLGISMTVTVFLEDFYKFAYALDGDISDYIKETTGNTVPEESLHKAKIYDQSKGEYVEIELMAVGENDVGAFEYKFIYDKQIFSITANPETLDLSTLTDELIIMDLLEEYEKIK